MKNEILTDVSTKCETVEALVSNAREHENCGNLEGAVTIYNRILGLDEYNKDALWGLAQLRRDLGDDERALRCLSRLEATGDERAAALIEDIEGQDAEQSSVDGRRATLLSPTDADLVLFAGLFAGREGVHARQWCSADGRCGYSPVHQPLTPALVRKHVMGAATLGAYVVKRDNSCGFLALDVDANLKSSDVTRSERRAIMEETLGVVRRLHSIASNLQLDGLLEESGNKGFHLWIFFDEPYPAWRARSLGRTMVSRFGDLPAGVSVEIFPAQGRVKKGGLGNLIKLPLGIHQKSGRPSRVIGEDGAPLDDPFSHLRQISRVSAEVLDNAMDTMSSELELEPALAGVDPENNGGDGSADFSHARPQIVTEEEYNIGDDEEVAELRSHCAIIDEMAQKALDGELLSHDEQSVITYTLGHLNRGPQAVNHLLSCAGYTSQPLKSRLRGNPTSCAKMRARLGHNREKCSCSFDETLGSYPHPLLHLSSLAAQRQEKPRLEGNPTPHELAALDRELGLVRQEIKRLVKAAQDIEARMNRGKSDAVAGPVKVTSDFAAGKNRADEG